MLIVLGTQLFCCSILLGRNYSGPEELDHDHSRDKHAQNVSVNKLALCLSADIMESKLCQRDKLKVDRKQDVELPLEKYQHFHHSPFRAAHSR